MRPDQLTVNSMAHKLIRWAMWLITVSVAAFGFSIAAAAQDLSFSATMDHTTVDVGEPDTLTLTLVGDVTGAKLEDLQLPEGITVAAQSRSTNFSIHGGAVERSMNLVYLLVAQAPGTFTLGPFKVTQHGKDFQTEAIELTVKKSALPPALKHRPQGERYLL